MEFPEIPFVPNIVPDQRPFGVSASDTGYLREKLRKPEPFLQDVYDTMDSFVISVSDIGYLRRKLYDDVIEGDVDKSDDKESINESAFPQVHTHTPRRKCDLSTLAGDFKDLPPFTLNGDDIGNEYDLP